MVSQTPSSKNPISIKLAESAVFLRSQGTSRHHPRPLAQSADAPGILRGLLVLNFEKPVKVSNIVVNLTCTSSATWQEGIGARRIDITEEHTVFKANQTFFKASRNDRRRASLPPAISSNQVITPTFRDEAPSYTPTTPDERPRHLRRLSADLANFQPEALERSESRYSPPPTPLTGLNRSESQGSFSELRAGQRNSVTSFDPLASPSGVVTPFRGRSSRRPSFDDVPEDAVAPSTPHRHTSSSITGHLREVSLTPQTPLSPAASRQSSQDRTQSRRRSARFSLGAVSQAILDKMRTSSPRRLAGPSRSRDSSPDRGRSRGNTREEVIKPKDVAGAKTTDRIERYLNKGSEGADWKEFRPGVYTYAISIPIPVDQPPSLECAFGRVSWRLKATVHRPGAFTSKYHRSMNITVIHNPIDEDQEEVDSVTVERHWDQQLQYMLSLSARHFYIGGTIPFSLTLLPLAKVKVHKLTVYIEERIDYLTQMKRVARSDPRTHIVLLSAKSNDGSPILPIESDDPNAFRESPLHQFLGNEDDISEMTSSLMGPGPWTLHKDLELPSSCSVLHWTNLNKRSNVLINHVLKCVIRVERGDDLEVDKKTGKRKLFDIIIQTEVDIRSCRCNPNWAGLPPYAETSQDTRTFEEKCPCQLFGKRQGESAKRVTSRQSTDSDTSAVETASIEATMLSLRGSDAFYRNNVQYERLVSGQETESGEVPPPYPPA